jgi:hypothetical protein
MFASEQYLGSPFEQIEEEGGTTGGGEYPYRYLSRRHYSASCNIGTNEKHSAGQNR